MFKIKINTIQREQFIDITDKLNYLVADSGFVDGIATVFIPHTTAGVTINENADPTVKSDILKKLSALVPYQDGYSHLEGNSDSHIKTLMTGSSCMIPVVSSRLQLGTWQGVYFCEYDGPRTREIWIKLLGEFEN